MTFSLAAIDANVLAAIAAAGGAILVKIVEKWAIRRSETLSDASRIRDELRTDIIRLRKENQDLETEALSWHEKYWDVKTVHESDKAIQNEFRLEVLQRLERIEQKHCSGSDDINKLKDLIDDMPSDTVTDHEL